MSTANSAIENQSTENRIVSVVHIISARSNAAKEQSLHRPNLESQIASKIGVQAAIMHQTSPQRILADYNGYPMACLPIANRPIVAHQIKYLETNGVFNIYIVVHQDAASKTRTYLRDHYEADSRSNIFIVVIQDEETEGADALKMICLL